MVNIKNKFPLYCPECGDKMYLVDVEEDSPKYNQFTGKKARKTYSISLCCGNCLGSEGGISQSWPPNISDNTRHREDFTQISKRELSYLVKNTKDGRFN